MAWTETTSRSFVARHDGSNAHHAQDLLEDLESFRGELGEHFEVVPSGVAVVIHQRSLALTLAQPWLPLARLAADPTSRRYMAGWFSNHELHVLSPSALDDRASGAEGSREALLLSPLHEYAHVVIGANNADLPPPFTPRSFRRYIELAWLCEGAATHLSGQTRYLRAAIARRLREGREPAFPPSARDAILLGSTIFALLEREHGRERTIDLVASPLAGGARRAIERAFGRSAASVERDWRDALERIADSGTVYDLRQRRARRSA